MVRGVTGGDTHMNPTAKAMASSERGAFIFFILDPSFFLVAQSDSCCDSQHPSLSVSLLSNSLSTPIDSSFKLPYLPRRWSRITVICLLFLCTLTHSLLVSAFATPCLLFGGSRTLWCSCLPLTFVFYRELVERIVRSELLVAITTIHVSITRLVLPSVSLGWNCF